MKVNLTDSLSIIHLRNQLGLIFSLQGEEMYCLQQEVRG